ncbi:MAG: Wadjet anti-phage system protein JetD domain-containing protein [Fusicatenibacter sp.]
MKKYDEIILNELLDKYENSLLYSGKNQRNQTISVGISKRLLPEYFDETSLAYDMIHTQLLEVAEKGYLRLIWKNKKEGHILEKCQLCTEKTEDIYRYLHRLPRKEMEEKILELCRSYTGSEPVLDRFLKWVEERILCGESVRRYVELEHPEEFEKRCQLMIQILSNREEIFLREFSVRYWKDSKTAEKEIAGVAGIIARFCEDQRFLGLTADQILEEYNIYRNPSWVMMKGCGSFLMEGEPVLLEKFCGGIGVSSRDIDRIVWEPEKPPKRVLTIENLTSFHRCEEAETLVIYLGGYHNQSKRVFLKKIYQTYPGAVYEHSGDIDCGGFFIWKDLCQKTGIPFGTWKMDEKAYLSGVSFGKELTEYDRRELEKMMEDPFFAEQKRLFEQMQKMGIKIEQEVFSV